MDLTRFGDMLIQPDLARHLYQKLHGTGPVISSALKDMQKFILWAPSEPQRLLAMIAESLKIAQSGAHKIDMRLNVPYNPMPGCDSSDMIQELWSSPLLQRKYAPMIRGVVFYTQPVKCVFTGPVGPLHHCKSLAMFHVSNQREQIPSIVSNWKSTLPIVDMGFCVLVDLPIDQLYTALRSVQALNIKGLIGWDNSRRSNAHSADRF